MQKKLEGQAKKRPRQSQSAEDLRVKQMYRRRIPPPKPRALQLNRSIPLALSQKNANKALVSALIGKAQA
eukprot:c29527_g1_i1 orf=3-209(-)